ncbi:ribosomal protein L23 [Paenibacillus sacheonensis]|nr:ribosomal protein L23 [Paenibacillus sacheonensis]
MSSKWEKHLEKLHLSSFFSVSRRKIGVKNAIQQLFEVGVGEVRWKAAARQLFLLRLNSGLKAAPLTQLFELETGEVP